MKKDKIDFEEDFDVHEMAMMLGPLVRLIEIGLEKGMTSKELASYAINVFKEISKEMTKEMTKGEVLKED